MSTYVDPPIVVEPLGTQPELVALTQAAAVWAARVPLVREVTATRPRVTLVVSNADGVVPPLYTEDGVTADGIWRAALLAPDADFTGEDGDAAPFAPGVRGRRSTLPAAAVDAMRAVVAAVTQTRAPAADFSGLLTPASCACNVWRYGPGALALDFVVGPQYAGYSARFTARFSFSGCTPREIYTVRGADGVAGGGLRTVRLVSETEAELVLDLRQADVSVPTYVRTVVVWETPVAGAPRQCLAVVRPPQALPAPAAGAVYAGGSVLGSGAYPAEGGLRAGYVAAGVPGTVACSAPSGLSVLAARAEPSAVFDADRPFIFSVSRVAVQGMSLACMVTVAPLGRMWRGGSDTRSQLSIAVDVGDGVWVELVRYSFSNDAEYAQSYPAVAGAAVNPAYTGSSARDALQFSSRDAQGVLRADPDAVYRVAAVTNTTGTALRFRVYAGRPFVVLAAQVWGQAGAHVVSTGSELARQGVAPVGGVLEASDVRDARVSAADTASGLVATLSLAPETAEAVVWSTGATAFGGRTAVRQGTGEEVVALVSGLPAHNRLGLQFDFGYVQPTTPGPVFGSSAGRAYAPPAEAAALPAAAALDTASRKPRPVVPGDMPHNWGPDYIPPMRGRGVARSPVDAGTTPQPPRR